MAIAVLALVGAVGVSSCVGAAKAMTVSSKVSSKSIAEKGGSITFLVDVHGASTCTFSSSPVISHFDGTVNCSSGSLARKVSLKKDAGSARTYVLRVTAKNTKSSVKSQATFVQIGRAKAYLDPTFAQSPTNPLKVTWCASVDNDATTSPCQFSNGTDAPSSSKADRTLHPGVLDFYVGPQGSVLGLVCSTDVGPAVDYADCTINLTTLGEYTVTTEYLSGGSDSSATETSTINPFTTTTTTSIQSPVQLSMSGCTEMSPCTSTVTSQVVDQNGNIVTGTNTDPDPMRYAYSDGTPGSALLTNIPGICPIHWYFLSGTLHTDECGDYVSYANPPSSFSEQVTGEFAGYAGYAPSSSAPVTLTVNIGP